jgi:hypothetical protein
LYNGATARERYVVDLVRSAVEKYSLPNTILREIEVLYDKLVNLELYILDVDSARETYLMLDRIAQLEVALETNLDRNSVLILLEELRELFRETYTSAFKQSKRQRVQLATPLILSLLGYILCYLNLSFLPLIIPVGLTIISLPLYYKTRSLVVSYSLAITGGLTGIVLVLTMYGGIVGFLDVALYMLSTLANITYLSMYEVVKTRRGVFEVLLTREALKHMRLEISMASKSVIDPMIIFFFNEKYGEVGVDLAKYKVNVMKANGFSDEEILERMKLFLQR